MKHVIIIVLLALLLVGCRTIQHKETSRNCRPPEVAVGPERTVSVELCTTVDIICYDKAKQDCTVDFDTFHTELCVVQSDVPGRICKIDDKMPQHTIP